MCIRGGIIFCAILILLAAIIVLLVSITAQKMREMKEAEAGRIAQMKAEHERLIETERSNGEAVGIQKMKEYAKRVRNEERIANAEVNKKIERDK